VGSIGVISLNVGLPGLLRKYGVVPRIQATGRNMANMHPLADFSEAQENLIRESMSGIHANFVQFIKERRPRLRGDNVDREIFSGRVYMGERAVQLGLADGVATLHELLKQKFNGAKVVEVRPKSGQNLLDALAGLIQSSAKFIIASMGHAFLEMALSPVKTSLTCLEPEIMLG